MPIISVIMGVYNASNRDMIAASINSVLNQTYGDFELIICDDGSIDDTNKILREYMEIDKRITIITNAFNQGLAFSLNRCLKISKGKYIARMDVDDVSLPNRFEREIEFLEENRNYAMVGTSINLFDDKGVWGNRKMIENPCKKDFLFGSPFIHPTILIRKNILEKLNGYRVSKETLRAEDYDLFMRLYNLGYKGYNIPEFLYNYREDVNSYKKRKYFHRFDEARVRYKGFKLLGLLPEGLIFVLKPLIVGLIPQHILAIFRNERL